MAVVAIIAVASGDGGIKDAIQDLYAKIRSLETSRAGAIHLDNAISNKAKFVINRLWKMVDRDQAVTSVAAAAAAAIAKSDRALVAKAVVPESTVNDAKNYRKWRPQHYGKETLEVMNESGTERSAKNVRKIMNKLNDEMSLATDRVTIVAQPDVKTSFLSSSPSCATDVNVEELERKFLAMLQQYDMLKKTTAFHSTSVGHKAVYGHGCKARSSARQNRIFQHCLNKKTHSVRL